MIVVPDSVAGIIEGFIWSLGVLIVLIPTSMFGPSLENKYFPVVGDFKISSTKAFKNFSIYDLEFEKLRDCEIDVSSISWYVTDAMGRQDRVIIEIPQSKGSASRSIGKNVSKGWKVYNRDYIITQQKLVLYHNCHVAWRTKTEVTINE